MMESKINLKGYISNLFVLAIAIMLVYMAKRNYMDYFRPENFVPDVPKTPIGSDPTPIFDRAGYPQGQPMTYKTQMWPARIPYQPKPNTPCTTNQSNGKVECPGAIGVCKDGFCTPGKFNRTDPRSAANEVRTDPRSAANEVRTVFGIRA